MKQKPPQKMTEAQPPFFDESNCPFEVAGFYEEYQDADTSKCLGQITIPALTVPAGARGRYTTTWTENHTVLSPLGAVRVVKASKKKPIRVLVMQQVICGRRKTK